MESFKDYLLEWGFFKKNEAPKPAPAPEKPKAAASGPKKQFGFMSLNRNDPAHMLSRDTLKSEYSKHNGMTEKAHTPESKARLKELEDEVARRGGQRRPTQEWHQQYLNRKTPEGKIHWKDEHDKPHRGY